MKDRFKPIAIIKEEPDVDMIKRADQMQNPKETIWYDDLDESDPSKIIDNNEVDDFDKKQKLEIKVPAAGIKTNSVVSMIRRKLQEEQMQEQVVEEPVKIAKPGEFVIMYKNRVCNIGTLEEMKQSCIEIVEKNDNVSDDDILVFLRIPLQKLFK